MSPTTPPTLAIPRIIPPQGERLPLSGLAPQPLPLEPSVVPNPPIRPEDIPRRLPTPKVQAAVGPIPAPVKPWFLVEGTAFPGGEADVEHQLLWCFGNFPHDEVRAQWAEAVGVAVFDKILLRFQQESEAYAANLAAWQAQGTPITSSPQIAANVPETTAKAAITEVAEEPSSEALKAIHAPTPGPMPVVLRVGPPPATPHVNPPRITFPEERQLAPAPAASPASVQATQAERVSARRLTAKARQSVLERYAQGQDKLAIAQATGLPMDLVERAIASAPSTPAQAEAAETAYQAELQAGPEGPETEERAQVVAAEAVVRALTVHPGQGARALDASEIWTTHRQITKLRNAAHFGGYLKLGDEERDEDVSRARLIGALEMLKDDIDDVLEALR